jgi:hypothetical protein
LFVIAELHVSTRSGYHQVLVDKMETMVEEEEEEDMKVST